MRCIGSEDEKRAADLQEITVPQLGAVDFDGVHARPICRARILQDPTIPLVFEATMDLRDATVLNLHAEKSSLEPSVCGRQRRRGAPHRHRVGGIEAERRKRARLAGLENQR